MPLRTTMRRIIVTTAAAAAGHVGAISIEAHPARNAPPGLGTGVTSGGSNGITEAEMEAVPAVPPLPSPWHAFATKVWAGPAIQFTGRSTGFMIEGQGPAPRTDERLAAGWPAESWPGTSVELTRDGGRHWAKSLTVPDGIWSIDFPSSAAGWAVGVTTLYKTSDQGRTWTALQEPTGTHLVEVRFDRQGRGIGLDTAGYMHTSADGGATWTAAASGGPYLDICTTPRGEWIGADGFGRLWEVGTPSPRLIFTPGKTVIRRLRAPQISLSCGGGTWESIRQPAGLGQGFPPGLLVFDSVGGGPFQPALSSGTLGVDARGSGLATLETGFTLTSGGGRSAVLAIRSAAPGKLEVVTLAPGGGVKSASTIAGLPDLDSLPAFMTSAIQGMALLPDGHGWLKVDAELPSGGIQAPDPHRYMSLAYFTSDGGRVWHLRRKAVIRTG